MIASLVLPVAASALLLVGVGGLWAAAAAVWRAER